MLNHRFKNPYKKQTKQLYEEILANDGLSFDFKNFKIYEYDINKELAPKGNNIINQLNFGLKSWKCYRLIKLQIIYSIEYLLFQVYFLHFIFMNQIY